MTGRSGSVANRLRAKFVRTSPSFDGASASESSRDRAVSSPHILFELTPNDTTPQRSYLFIPIVMGASKRLIHSQSTLRGLRSDSPTTWGQRL
jgi:hypothetical protein